MSKDRPSESQRLISCSSAASPALILFAGAFWLGMLSSMPAAAALFPCWGCTSSGWAWGRHCSAIVDPLEPFEARLQGHALPVRALVSSVIIACIVCDKFSSVSVACNAMCQVKSNLDLTALRGKVMLQKPLQDSHVQRCSLIPQHSTLLSDISRCCTGSNPVKHAMQQHIHMRTCMHGRTARQYCAS
jgi:hypothetical protein